MKPYFIDSGAVMSLGNHSLLIGYGTESFHAHHAEVDPLRPAFFFPDYFLENPHPWVQYSHWEEVGIDFFESFLDQERDFDAPIAWQEPDQTLFYNLFSQLKKKLTCAQLQKGVVYAFSEAFSSMTPSLLKRSLCKAVQYIRHYPGHLYGFWNQKGGMLGVTPEILFSYAENGQILETMALAGTCAKNHHLGKFQADPKQLEEHHFVVQGITRSFHKMGRVLCEQLAVLELPTLNHLVTPIQVHLDAPCDFLQLVHTLHPTPAVGAFPKERGWEWLKECQKRVPRGRYGAPVGFIFPAKEISKCLVGIRNVQWDQNHMRIGAGCGIVNESTRELEWEELCLKIRAIRHLLAL